MAAQGRAPESVRTYRSYLVRLARLHPDGPAITGGAVAAWFADHPQWRPATARTRYIQDRNAERRHLTAGQQAMGRALMLQAAGKRKNGRWERGSLAIPESQNIDKAEYDLMRKAGLVLDTAARAAAAPPTWQPSAAGAPWPPTPPRR